VSDINITAAMVKELRAQTGAGVLDCRNALVQMSGDFAKADELLRKQGMAEAEKRKERETKEGVIASYIHAGARIGSMVEVNCESDFVARTDRFKDLAKELTMQVAATRPLWVGREDIPEEVIAAQKQAFLAEMAGADKPAHVMERIIGGKLDKWVQESCLLEQPYIRDSDITIRELVAQTNAVLGENIVVRRFVRFELGDELK
jgi:elongation factor Ts